MIDANKLLNNRKRIAQGEIFKCKEKSLFTSNSSQSFIPFCCTVSYIASIYCVQLFIIHGLSTNVCNFINFARGERETFPLKCITATLLFYLSGQLIFMQKWRERMEMKYQLFK